MVGPVQPSSGGYSSSDETSNLLQMSKQSTALTQKMIFQVETFTKSGEADQQNLQDFANTISQLNDVASQASNLK